MDQQCTNELTPEIKAQQEKSLFTAEEIVAMDDDARAILAEGRVLVRKHPANVIWRIAMEGSITHRGEIVAYPDGSTAAITTSAGKVSLCKGAGVALDGSMLNNGDEIITILQRHTYLVTRNGIASGADFLTVTGA